MGTSPFPLSIVQARDNGRVKGLAIGEKEEESPEKKASDHLSINNTSIDRWSLALRLNVKSFPQQRPEERQLQPAGHAPPVQPGQGANAPTEAKRQVSPAPLAKENHCPER